MTTIACNRDEIAADSKFSFDMAGFGAFPTEKLYRIGNSIFGEAGDTACTSKIIKWLQRGQRPDEEPEFTKDERGEGIVLELAPDGIFVWDNALFRYPVHEKTFAIGSGRKIALYCMRKHKMTPEQAVREACEFDDGCAGPVANMKLHT